MAETAIAARPLLLLPESGLDKAAILLLTLGAEAAGTVLKHLTEGEVRQLSAAMTRMRTIPRGRAAAVHEEAWRWLTSREGYLIDGDGFVRQLLTASQDQQALRDLARASDRNTDQLGSRFEEVSPQVLAQVLGEEHPQVIAVVLAHLVPRQAAEVLATLPEDLQADIVHRIFDLKTVPEELLADVAAILETQVQGLGKGTSGSQVGGAKLAAEIMNLVDKGVEARVFGYLDDAVPPIAETIRNLMLTFEDLLQLDNRGMQVLLKEVAREDLMFALKTASPAMSEKILGNISQRASEILQEDMSTMGPVRLKDVEKAQANIITIARRLAEEQKIQLGGSGEDALV